MSRMAATRAGSANSATSASREPQAVATRFFRPALFSESLNAPKFATNPSKAG